MENWELDFHWLKVRHFIKDTFQTASLPDMETILFLIGVQELGRLQPQFSKEEKMDLMHIAVARLLSVEGYFKLEGKDAKGWPVWEEKIPLDFDEKTRNTKLKHLIIEYFTPLLDGEEPKTL